MCRTHTLITRAGEGFHNTLLRVYTVKKNVRGETAHWLYCGVFVPKDCLLIVAAPSVSHYRNKLTFHYQHKMQAALSVPRKKRGV